MTQNPGPTDPSTPDPYRPDASSTPPPPEAPSAPSYSSPAPEAQGAAPYSAPEPGPDAHTSYSEGGYPQQGAGAPQGGYPQGTPPFQGSAHAGDFSQAGYGAAPGGGGGDTPPPGIKGVYEGPLPGQSVSASDTKLWSILAQLSTVAGYVIGAGFLGWVGPLIIFLIYKDRDRFVRFNAAEALNAAIAVFIAEVVLAVVVTIIAIVTFGIGSVLYVLLGVPAILHIVFAIIGAVKANERTWWNYPVNIRLVK